MNRFFIFFLFHLCWSRSFGLAPAKNVPAPNQLCDTADDASNNRHDASPALSNTNENDNLNKTMPTFHYTISHHCFHPSDPLTTLSSLTGILIFTIIPLTFINFLTSRSHTNKQQS